MKFRFGIRNKIFLGFGILITVFIVNTVVSIWVLNDNRKLVREISTRIDPSMDALQGLTLIVNRAKMFSSNWFYMQANKDDKDSLTKLIAKDYPALEKRMDVLVKTWPDSLRKPLDTIRKEFSSLLVTVNDEVMSQLKTLMDYEDPTINVMAEDAVTSTIIPKASKLIARLQQLSFSWRKIKSEYERDLVNSTDNLQMTVISLMVVLLCISVFAAVLMANVITRPVNRIKNVMQQLGRGEIPQIRFRRSNDEIGDMQYAIENVVKGLSQTTTFARKIGTKELDAEFTPLSEGDVLGHSLIEMRENLKLADKKEKEQNWILDGAAGLDDILRKHNSIDPLSDEVLLYLIKRIGAIQGAFYVVTERDNKNYRNTFLEMKASYAYNRKKYLQKRFRMAEGLVGEAAIEQARILRTEIPRDYVTITSGILGDTRPSSLLIVPMVIDEVTYGAVELAAFEAFRPEQVQFIEEVAPNIARTIANILVNEHTRQLLEESQRMSNELQQQQEELRQNAEEMQVTQEELERTNMKLQEQVEEVNMAGKRMEELLYNASEIITIYEKDGLVRYISPSIGKILGYTPEELISLKGKTFVHDEDIHKSRQMFKDLIQDKTVVEAIQYRFLKKDGQWVWLEATGKNLLNDPSVKGIVINARDITERMKAEREERMRKNMQSLSENSPDLITRITLEGKITYTNPAILEYSGKEPSNFTGKFLNDVSSNSGIVTSWKQAIEEVKRSKAKVAFEAEYKLATEVKIMQLVAIPEFNEETMESVLVISHDITERKKSEQEIQNKNKKIHESITYSKRIQNAVIPDNKLIKQYFKNSFIYYKPRDIVSGDFPWMFDADPYIYMAVVDCTGHGVPGAMLSLVGCFLLNDITQSAKDQTPAQILDRLDQKVNITLNSDTSDQQIKDGMDIALCRINKKTLELDYAGAHRPLYVMHKSEFVEFKGDRWAIGGGIYKNQTNFTNHHIKLGKGDMFLMFSDGLPDQFGSLDGGTEHKYGTRRIKSALTDNKKKDFTVIRESIVQDFEQWSARVKQMDDVLLIGAEL